MGGDASTCQRARFGVSTRRALQVHCPGLEGDEEQLLAAGRCAELGGTPLAPPTGVATAHSTKDRDGSIPLGQRASIIFSLVSPLW